MEIWSNALRRGCFLPAAVVALLACGSRSELDQGGPVFTTADASAQDVASVKEAETSVDVPSEDVRFDEEATGLEADVLIVSEAPARWLLRRQLVYSGTESVLMQVSPKGFGQQLSLGMAKNVAWSWDGQLLAWIDPLGPAWIAAMGDHSIGEPVQVASSAAAMFWSPKRSRLLLALDGAGKSWRLVDASLPEWTTQDIELPASQPKSSVTQFEAWSPEGRRVLLKTDAYYSVGYVIDTTDPDLTPKPLDDFTQISLGLVCSWSSDGHWIACPTSTTPDSSVLCAIHAWDVSADPFKRIALTDFDQQWASTPSIEFAYDDWAVVAPQSPLDLFAVHVDGTDHPAQVPIRPGGDFWWFLSPDRRRLQHHCPSPDFQSPLCVSSFDDVGVNGPIVVWNGPTEEPRWSPDGRALTFVTHDVADIARLFMVEVQSTTVGQTTLLGEGAAHALWRPSWSPDSTWIAYEESGGTDGHRALVVRDRITGSEAELFGPGEAVFSQAYFSADSRSVATIDYPPPETDSTLRVRFTQGRAFAPTLQLSIPAQFASLTWQPVPTSN